MVPAWETISKEKAGDFKIFDVLWVKRRHPVWQKESDFVVVDSPNWANIIPITSAGRIVMVEQFRQGTNSITLELPGGLIEQGELPEIAAKRECKEETGYSSDEKIELIGESLPNPAFMTNKCYTFVWENCQKVTGQDLDDNEELNVIELTESEIREKISSGELNHAIILSAFMHYFNRKL